ncbi:MAG: putative ABC transporter permease [Bacilli bacterium]|nr:putative ABC transporter permease [Bacilli bacterium]
MKYYLNLFIIFSIFGYIMELIFKLIFGLDTTNPLYGPWTPIYGFGSCVIIIVMRFIFNRIKAKRFIKIIIFTILTTLILTSIEFIGGTIMEKFTGKIAWDYSNLKFHIGKYISLEVSFIWMIMSLLLVYIVKPLLDKVIKKIPSIITYLVSFIIFIDLLYAVIFPHI